MYEENVAMSELIADAIIKRTQPMKDDMSERQAEKAYGTRWLRAMTQRGLAEWHRVGGRKVFSRHQLDCLRQAERRHASLVLKSIENTAIDNI